MSYVENNLNPGESIGYRARLHWIALFWPVFLCILFGLPGFLWMIAAIAIGSNPGAGMFFGLALGSLLLAALALFLGIAGMKAAEFAVTNKRVIMKAGVIQRKSTEMFLSKIESVGLNQGLLGRMLDYGTIVVRGTGGTTEPFNRIAHPVEFRRQVQEHIERGEHSASRP